MPWKWEHQFTHKNIQEDSRELEVGTGKGDFIRNLENISNCKCTGLELNPDIDKIRKKYGTDLKNETVQAHSKNNSELCDVVCTFQV